MTFMEKFDTKLIEFEQFLLQNMDSKHTLDTFKHTSDLRSVILEYADLIELFEWRDGIQEPYPGVSCIAVDTDGKEYPKCFWNSYKWYEEKYYEDHFEANPIKKDIVKWRYWTK